MRDYKTRLQLAMRDLPVDMASIVGKEIFYYSILDYMQKSGYLRDIVFMGGAALRLCYGSPRFSENLDFAGGADFNPTTFAEMTKGLSAFIEKHYGLQVVVNEPEPLRKNASNLKQSTRSVAVNTWRLSIETNPEPPDLKHQCIKIKITNVPSLQPEYRLIRDNCKGLHQAANIVVSVESRCEMMCDKLVSFPLADNIRYRDIWDICWLSRGGIMPDPALVAEKVSCYRVERSIYRAKIQHRIEQLHTIIHDHTMAREMTRFLPSNERETMKDPYFLQSLEHQMRDYLQLVARRLTDGTNVYYRL